MKRALMLASVLVLVGAPLVAQPPPPGQPLTLAASLQRGYNNIKMNLTQSVDKMPEADFGFKVGSMAETRTFAALFGHVANSQFGTCAAVKGVANPNQGNNLEQTATTKAAVVKALADSFAFCDDAFSGLNEQNALQMVKQGQGEIARGRARQPRGAQQRDVWHCRRVSPYQGAGATIHRTSGRRPGRTRRRAGRRRAAGRRTGAVVAHGSRLTTGPSSHDPQSVHA